LATRRPRTFASLASIGTVSALLAVAPAALADPSPEDIAAARSLGTEGVKLAESGDCKGAIPKLQAAEKLFHAPTTADRLGECQINVGQLVAGTETLNRVVREVLAPTAPAAFKAAQQRAQTALSAALPNIGQLKIHVDGVPADQVTVTVDDEKVSSVLFDSNRPTDPGTHQVKATAPGFADATQSVQLAAGASAAVTLTLTANAAPVPAPVPAPTPAGATPAPAPAQPTQPAPESHGHSRTLPIVLLAVGGAGLVVGSGFGVLALGTKSSLDGACTNKVCPSSSQSNINSLSTQAWVSNIGFGVGIVSAALGVYFLVKSGGSDEAKPAAAVTSPAPALRVQPWVGLGSAGLGGTFQ
jgi:hypothetical protein